MLLTQHLTPTRLSLVHHPDFLFYHSILNPLTHSAVSELHDPLKSLSPQDDFYKICAVANRALLREISDSGCGCGDDQLPLLDSTLSRAFCIGKVFPNETDISTEGASRAKEP